MIPTFTKAKVAIKCGNWKLHLRIASILTETEMQNKYREKKKLKKEFASISIQLKSMLGLFLYRSLIHEIHTSLKVDTKQSSLVMKRNFKIFRLHRKGKTKFQSQF